MSFIGCEHNTNIELWTLPQGYCRKRLTGKKVIFDNKV